MFTIGDVVKLNSGGQLMTVAGLPGDGWVCPDRQSVQEVAPGCLFCVWFHPNGDRERCHIKAACVTLVATRLADDKFSAA